MVRASINGETRQVSMEGVQSIGDLLKQLEIYVPSGDIVTDLRINGVECDGDPEARVRTLPAAGVNEIQLATRSPDAFAGEAQARLGQYLSAVHTRFERAIECFDGKNQGDALDAYRGGVQELGLLVSLCDMLRQLGMDRGTPDEAMTSDLQMICDRLWTAHDRSDFATLRDVLASRLLPLLERWRSPDGAPAGSQAVD